MTLNRPAASMWGSQLLPTAEQKAAARPSVWTQAPQRSLADYTSPDPAAAYMQRPGESDHGYVVRLRHQLQALNDRLDPASLAKVAESYNAAVVRTEQGTGPADLRAQLAAGGSGVGVYGTMTPQQRAAAVQARNATVAGQGDVAHQALDRPAGLASMASLNQIMRQREAERLGQQPKRAELPSGSSGTGWITTR